MSTKSISLATDPAGQVQVLSHDRDSFGVDSTQVGVFEQTDQVCFGGFLEGQHGLALESDVLLELNGDFPHESLERELADQKVSLKY